MFRRSKIKITPKIPQPKSSVDRASESSAPTPVNQAPTTSTTNGSSTLSTSTRPSVSTGSSTPFSNPTSTTGGSSSGTTTVIPIPRSRASSFTRDNSPSLPLPPSSSVINGEARNSIESIESTENLSFTVPSPCLSPSPTLQSQPTLPSVPILTRPVPPPSPPVTTSTSLSVTTTPPSLVSNIRYREGSENEPQPSQSSSRIRDESHVEPKRPRKRMKLSPEDLLDRNSITLYHLIHASITRTKKGERKKTKNNKNAEEAGDEEIGKTPESTEKSVPNSQDTTRIDHEDTMDSVVTTISKASTIITGDSLAEEETKEPEKIGPRVKVGPDGQLIIDEESLVIKKPKPAEAQTIEEAVSGKTTYASFRKRPPTARWSKAETIEFYTALNLIGPDFSLMANLFFNGKRSRTDLKNKFRRENKLNKPVIEKALYEADVEYCLAQEAVQTDHS